nr:reverse transcriptase domain-containing protein [Tanacetum cinerariifolium]
MMKMFRGKAISEDKGGASSSHAATYLNNKMSMKILEWKSPYEKLFGQPLVYDHLRVIGCLCYASITVLQKDKFDNKGIKDVVFKEDVFPFKDFKKPKGSLFVHDFPSFGDEFYPETTQTPLPLDPALVIPNTHIPLEPDNENSEQLAIKDEFGFVVHLDLCEKKRSVEEKTALIIILKSHKRAIAWKLSDIKGINPEFYTHKILMEEDFEPAVQHQIRVNPKIHDVIKQEVIKLLEAELIYPISNSPWISPVHCVPKKRGFTVVENEDNELIPTRLLV